MIPRKAVYFFCRDLTRDPVAHHIYEASRRMFELKESSITVDSRPVLLLEDHRKNSFFYVQTDDVLSHDYARYMPVLNEYFDDFDFAGVVNWHEGKNAPDSILTVHTTGDVVSGYYGLSEPVCTRNLMLAVDDNRQTLGLDSFTTISEGTHWSGIPYGGKAELIPQYHVPLVDVEIGSSQSSWSNTTAAEAIARSLPQVFASRDVDQKIKVLLCVGGVHLEPSFASAVLTTRDAYPLAAGHILPNHWIVDGKYEAESGLEKLESCVNSIIGGIHAIAFHDNLKGVYKAQLRLLGEQMGVPLFKHQRLRAPESLPLW